jgi:hypothetical protein
MQMMNTTLNILHCLPGQTDLNPFTDNPPPGQPYTAAPWNYNGNSGATWGDLPLDPYPSDVVDWVLVQVRENGNTENDVIWTCAGWLHKDGRVTFPDAACGNPVINLANPYYIVVQHRNHLGVMSPMEVDILCDGAYIYWDFRADNSYQPPFRTGQKIIDTTPETWGMLAANCEQVNSIQAINSTDRTLWKAEQNKLGYYRGDHDLDISVDSQDETIWKHNQNKTTGVVFY